jgi:hypothetical protein
MSTAEAMLLPFSCFMHDLLKIATRVCRMNENLANVDAAGYRAIRVIGPNGGTASMTFHVDAVRDFSNEKLALLVGHDVRSTRSALRTLAEAVFGTADREPNVYGDYDNMNELLKIACGAQVQQFDIDEARRSGHIAEMCEENENLRDVLRKLSGETFGYDLGDEPNVYGDSAALAEMRSEVLRLIPDLELREVDVARTPGMH